MEGKVSKDAGEIYQVETKAIGSDYQGVNNLREAELFCGAPLLISKFQTRLFPPPQPSWTYVGPQTSR